MNRKTDFMRKKIIYLICFLCLFCAMATPNDYNKKCKVMSQKTNASSIIPTDESANKESSMELWPINELFLSQI